MKPSRKGENYVQCTTCHVDFSIAHSGSYDITHHIKSSKHRSNAEAKGSTRSIEQFMTSASADLGVIRAETLWTQYVVERNMPFAASDDFTSVVKKIFPDSKIASQFACRRTKTTAIARTLGQQIQGEIFTFHFVTLHKCEMQCIHTNESLVIIIMMKN